MNVYNNSLTSKYEIPINHIDYEYIEKCTDAKELEKIVKVLRSGSEGSFPDLERFAENKLTELDPKSKVLRKTKLIGSVKFLDDGAEIIDDIQGWRDHMTSRETTSEPTAKVLPPVRQGKFTKAAKESKDKTTSKSSVPKSYSDWDKIDLDAEMDKVDEVNEHASDAKTNKRPNITKQEFLSLSESERISKSSDERLKGNEAFRSSDFEEAVSYYTRSMTLDPSNMSIYNNRAQTYIKMKKWQKALKDCEHVLDSEPLNIKALCRRATVYKHLENYKKAIVDIEIVLKREPTNKTALSIECDLKKYLDELKVKGRRMTIVEIDSDESEDEDIEHIELQESGITEIVDEDMYVDQEILTSKKSDSAAASPTTTASTASTTSKPRSPATTPSPSASGVSAGSGIVDVEDTCSSDSSSFDVINADDFTTRQEQHRSSNDDDDEDKANYEIVDRDGTVVSAEDIEFTCDPLPATTTAPNTATAATTAATTATTTTANTSPISATTTPTATTTPKSITTSTNARFTTNTHNTTTTTTNNTVKQPKTVPSKPCRPCHSEVGGSGDASTAPPTISFSSSKRSPAPGKVAYREDKPCCSKSVVNAPPIAAACKQPSPAHRSPASTNTTTSASHVKANSVAVQRSIPRAKAAAIEAEKQRGNASFKAGAYADAIQSYDSAIELALPYGGNTLATLYSNRGAGHQKCGNSSSAEKDCNASLDLLPHLGRDLRVKTVLRRAVAREHRERYAQAYQDYHMVATRMDQRSLPARQGADRCMAHLKELKGHKWRQLLPESDYSAILDDYNTCDVVSQVSDEIDYDDIKAKGNECVKKADYERAVYFYTKCISADQHTVACLSNRSLCHLKLARYQACIEDCSSVIGERADHVKCLFRRAQAYEHLKEYAKAVKDLSYLLSFEPTNNAALQLMFTCDKLSELNMGRKTIAITETEDSSSETEEDDDPSDTYAPSNPPPPSSQKKAGAMGASPSLVRNSKAVPELNTPLFEHLTASIADQRGSTTTTNKAALSTPELDRKEGETPSPRRTTKPKPEEHTEYASKRSMRSGASSQTTHPSGGEAVSHTKAAGAPLQSPSSSQTPRLTSYEFLKTWTSHKHCKSVDPFANLLKQIDPASLSQVITNKLDGPMLENLVHCCREFVRQGNSKLALEFLIEIPKIKRFEINWMFMSKKEKDVIKEIQNICEKEKTELNLKSIFKMYN